MKRVALSLALIALFATAALAAKFPIKNFSYRSSMTGTRFIGEIINDSKNDYSTAVFKLSLYDKDGKLLDVADILISNFPAGSTKSWDADCLETVNGIASYKVQFETGM